MHGEWRVATREARRHDRVSSPTASSPAALPASKGRPHSCVNCQTRRPVAARRSGPRRYAMDQQQLVRLMNEDLGTEYRSIVQYIQHIATLKGLEVQSVVGELRQHLTQELNHAMVLAEQIDFLGGIPT